MRQYLDLLSTVLANGTSKAGPDRHRHAEHLRPPDCASTSAEGFPAVTTKKLHLRSVIGELIWFLRGETNVGWLQERGITIWDEWADAGRRAGPGVRQPVALLADPGRRAHRPDQPGDRVHPTNPDSRRHLVSAWNVAELDEMALPPCHTMFQFYVAEGRLSCQLYQRSADVFLGVPFNIASYALLTHMVAQVTGLAGRRVRAHLR